MIYISVTNKSKPLTVLAQGATVLVNRWWEGVTRALNPQVYWLELRS